MRKETKIRIWGFLFVGVLGVLFHFAYDFLGQSDIAGLFFPVNESIWEHLKLVLLPVILWWIVVRKPGDGRKRTFASRVWAVSLAMLFLPVAFYTYSGVIGQRFVAVDISLFFLADFLYFWLESRFLRKEKPESEGENVLAVMVFFLWVFAFGLFSFFPPELGIFQVPQ